MGIGGPATSALSILHQHGELDGLNSVIEIGGQDLNESTCGCPAADPDERWKSLAGLSDQLKTEEASGSTQA